jgi:hypothetical protein
VFLQIDRHCTRLDNDLQKFEDEQLIGPGRPSSVQGVSMIEEVNEVLDGKWHIWRRDIVSTQEGGGGRQVCYF